MGRNGDDYGRITWTGSLLLFLSKQKRGLGITHKCSQETAKEQSPVGFEFWEMRETTS